MIENKVSRRKEVIKIRTKINRKQEKRWTKLRVGFLKIYKFDKTLARLIKEKEVIQIRKIINEKILQNYKESQEATEQLYDNRLE